MSDGVRGLLGKLPPEPGRPTLQISMLALAPAIPIEVHNIELVPDPDMLGNDKWGDCVFAAIENDRRISAAALGVPITRLTAAQVVAKYCAYCGISTDPKNAPGPGAVIQRALKWVHDSSDWGGNHLLCFGTFPITQQAYRQAVAEFQSCSVGTEVFASMEYPARTWYNAPRGAYVGGHGIAGGSYDVTAVFIKTWGYLCRVNPSGFAAIDELAVMVWDFQWESLSYDRQVSLVADYQALTGKTWTGPAPVAPPSPYIPRTAMNFTPIAPKRVLDTRNGTGHSGPLTNHAPITFAAGVPAGATAVTGNLTVTQQTDRGYLALTPTVQDPPVVSTLNFPLGDDRANGVTVGLNTDGTLALELVTGIGKTAHAIFDVTGYFS